MKNYARIEDGLVIEVICVDDDFDMASAFNPSLVWVECGNSVSCMWTYSKGKFKEPQPQAPDVDATANAERARRDSILRNVYDPAIIMAQRALRIASTQKDRDYAEQKISELDSFARLLQDIPTQEGFPLNIEWPQTPEI